MNAKLRARLTDAYHQVVFRGSRAFRGIDRNKVVFSCFKGRGYGDNPRCISERLHQRRPETDIVWLFNYDAMRTPPANLPDYVRRVFIDSSDACRELATARVWVDNFTRDARFAPQKGRQFYMQTWHGDRPIKKICYDTGLPDYRLEEVADRVLTGSEFGERMYRTAFRYPGEYLRAGAPRNDALVRDDPAEVRAMREKLGVTDDTGLLLYAPTYREFGEIVPREVQMDLGRTLSCLEEKTGRRWVCMFRAHYKSAGIDIDAVKDRIMDVTRYPEMTDLLMAADLLLTDYSSAATDYVLRGDRPAIFYIPDWERYSAAHGVYYDVHDTPFMIAHDQAELEALIGGLTEEATRENCAAINRWFGCYETGRATDAVCDYIIDKLGE